MPSRPEPGCGALRRPSIGQRPHAHPVAERGPRAARTDIERGPAVCLQLVNQSLGVRTAGKAAELHSPASMPRRSRRTAHARFGARRRCFKRRSGGGPGGSPGRPAGGAPGGFLRLQRRDGGRRARRRTVFGRRALGCTRRAAAAPLAAADSDAASDALPPAEGGAAADAPCAASGSAVAVLVVKSTETVRLEAGNPTVSGGADGGCLGPESISGTISTISTTSTLAPIRRSLTRRSIMAAEYIRAASREAAHRALRANPSRARRCGRSRRSPRDRRGERPRPRRRTPQRCPRAHGCVRCRARPRFAQPIARRSYRGHLRSRRATIRRCNRRAPPRRRRHPCRPKCRIPPAFVRADGIARKFSASTAAAAGLCATSRMKVGPAVSMT